MNAPVSSNIVWHGSLVTRVRRHTQNGHASVILWFTGLSGAGKSTLAHLTEEHLHRAGCRTYVLDGDNVRHGLSADLGFSVHDRQENIRRIGETAKLFLDAGVITLTAFISPFRADRERVRRLVSQGEFIEIYVRCTPAVCESRDVKGLYRLARAGRIPEFTGVSSPYEEPLNPELVLDTSSTNIADCVDRIVGLLHRRGIAPVAATPQSIAALA